MIRVLWNGFSVTDAGILVIKCHFKRMGLFPSSEDVISLLETVEKMTLLIYGRIYFDGICFFLETFKLSELLIFVM